MGSKKWVYRFGDGLSEGSSDMRGLLGNKGANLAEMARLGLPVPPGFTLTTEVGSYFLKNDDRFPDEVHSQIDEALSWMERVTGRGYGDTETPLLISARSGGTVSMPGMLDSILNIGLNDTITRKLLETSPNKRFVLDCYRRFLERYGSVVLDVPVEVFDDMLEDYRRGKDLRSETEIDTAGWQQLISAYQSTLKTRTGRTCPQDVRRQLDEAIRAVFRSWNSSRARSYRAMHGLDDKGGTAVTMQMMVFGNRSARSSSGVAFSRNPSTGAPGLYGEFLPESQGEDIVGGFRSPRPLTARDRRQRAMEQSSLEETSPELFRELQQVCDKLERRFKNMQEIEFTIDDGHLWLLQTRTGKRTLEAAIRIALELYDEGVIDQDRLFALVPEDEFQLMVRPVIDPAFQANLITRGLPASPGAESGELVFDPKEAVDLASEGRKVILVRNETNPADIDGMHAAAAMLTRRGGMTSHAAVIARGMGRPCIVDARDIVLDAKSQQMKIGEKIYEKGEVITIDGTNGRVFAGKAPLAQPTLSPHAIRLKALKEKLSK